MPNGRTPPDWVYFCGRKEEACRQHWCGDRHQPSNAWQRPLDRQAEQIEGWTDLLDAGNVAGDVLDGDGVLDCQAVRLALDARAVNQDAGVGGQAWGRARSAGQLRSAHEQGGGRDDATGETEADVVVEHGRLADGARVLQLEDTLLLDGEDDAVLAAHADRTGPFPDGLEGIVDLCGWSWSVSGVIESCPACSVRTWKR